MRQCGFVWCLRIYYVLISILGQTRDKYIPSQSMCVCVGGEVGSRVFGFRVMTPPARVCLRHSVLLLGFPEF